MLNVSATILKNQPYNNWLIALSGIAAVSIIAVFAPLLVYLIPGVFLFTYFWSHKDRLIVFLLIYTPFEELIIKLVPQESYAFVRFMWEGLLFIFITLMVVEKLMISKTWKKSIIDKFILVLLFAWFLSTIWNDVSWMLSIYQIKNLIRYITVFYIVYNLEPESKFINRIINLLIIMGVIQSLLCICQAIEGDLLVKLFRPKEVIIGGELIKGQDIAEGTYYTKFTGSFQRSNELAYYLVASIGFAMTKYFLGEKSRKMLLAITIMITALFLTSSRINWIALYFVVGIILVKIRSKFKIAYLVVPAAILALAIGSYSMINTGDLYSDFNIINRFMYIFTPEYIEIIGSLGRLYAILYVAPAVFMTNPILGIGPGSFMFISQQMSVEEIFGKADALGLEMAPLQYVHDVGIVALFIQVGLMGALAMIGIFYAYYRQASKKFNICKGSTGKILYLGAIGLIIATAIQQFASFNLVYRNQSLVIWTILGLTALYSSRSLNENNIS